MMVNYETVLGLTIFLCLGYYLQSGPKIGDFLPQSKVDQFVEDGIVIVDNLFTEEELETISSELMRRVSERPDDVRAEDLLNLHFNDSFILSITDDLILRPRSVLTVFICRAGQPSQHSLCCHSAAGLSQTATVHHEDPLQAARPES